MSSLRPREANPALGGATAKFEPVFTRGALFILIALLPVPVISSLVSFGLILPFLILSFSSSFYRERLKALLRLPATAPAPIAKVPPPTAEQGSPQ